MAIITTATAFAMEIENLKIAGQFARIISQKRLDLKKGFEANITVKRENTVQLGCDYATVVNNRAEAEGVADTVELQGLPDYLERVNGHITRHKTKGTLYIDAMPVNTNVTYYLNGEKVELDKIREMMYAKDLPQASKKPSTQGELEKEVKWRRYSLDNVLQIHAKNEVFEFVPETEGGQSAESATETTPMPVNA